VLIAGSGEATLRQVACYACASNFGAHERMGAAFTIDSIRDKLEILRRQCDAVGHASRSSIEQILAAQPVATIATVQNHYNLADRGSEAVLNFCSDTGLGFIPWSPVGGGDRHRSNGRWRELLANAGRPLVRSR